MKCTLIRLTFAAITLGLVVPAARGESPNQLTESEKLSGWKLLFDGKSTEGWRNYRDRKSVV